MARAGRPCRWVNLSPLQIRDLWLVDLVANIIKETAIEPARVVLEVTEGVLIDDPQEAQTRLETLRALGVRLALDDFGTGYSSLNYLQNFRSTCSKSTARSWPPSVSPAIPAQSFNRSSRSAMRLA